MIDLYRAMIVLLIAGVALIALIAGIEYDTIMMEEIEEEEETKK